MHYYITKGNQGGVQKYADKQKEKIVEGADRNQEEKKRVNLDFMLSGFINSPTSRRAQVLQKLTPIDSIIALNIFNKS